LAFGTGTVQHIKVRLLYHLCIVLDKSVTHHLMWPIAVSLYFPNFLALSFLNVDVF